MDNNIKREEYLKQIGVLESMIKKVDPDNKIYSSTLNNLEAAKEKLTPESQNQNEPNTPSIQKK